MKLELFKKANELDLEDAVELIREASLGNASAPRSFAAHCQTIIKKYCDPSLSSNEQLYLLLNPHANRHCAVCSEKLVRFYGPSRGWGKYCSTKCSTQSDERKKKYVETSLEKYGHTSPKKNSEVNKKTQETNLRKYGHVSNLHSEKFKDIIKEKILQKAEATKEKVKATCLQRYGATTALLSPKAKEKIKDAHYKKLMQRDQVRIEALKERGFELIEYNHDLQHKWKHECGNVFTDLSVKVSCDQCKKTPHRSQIEVRIFDYVKEIRPDLTVIHSHTPFSDSKRHVDIFIKELNLGIEINGTYWHQEDFDEGSMLLKTECAERDGFDLIHIWDNEWDDKAKQFLKAKLGLRSKIFARNTTVNCISAKNSAEFCEKYHRQGAVGAKHHIGLFHSGELISVLTIGKPRFEKSAEWEIIRFCTVHGKTVIGGLEKMLKFFEKEQKPTSILTYVDRAWGNGGVYKRAGFELVRKTEPGYFWTNSAGTVLSRYDTQKKKLAKLFGDKVDMTLTENQILKNLRFWKCKTVGNLLLIKKF